MQPVLAVRWPGCVLKLLHGPPHAAIGQPRQGASGGGVGLPAGEERGFEGGDGHRAQFYDLTAAEDGGEHALSIQRREQQDYVIWRLFQRFEQLVGKGGIGCMEFLDQEHFVTRFHRAQRGFVDDLCGLFAAQRAVDPIHHKFFVPFTFAGGLHHA